MQKYASSQKHEYLNFNTSLELKNIVNDSNYKFEHGGMVVYDVRALVSKSQNPSTPLNTSPRLISPVIDLNTKSNAKDMPPEALELLKKVKSMPASPDFSPCYTLYVPNDNVTLEFNSKFESGNLSRAIKLSDYEYSLYTQCDTNTTGNNHWYYFSVKNPRKTSITFHIVNMKKLDLLYRSGLKPVVYSVRSHQETGIEWQRDCSAVSYKNNLDTVHYTLSFDYHFKYSDDLVYFAYSVPYTYQQLNSYLNDIRYKYQDIIRINTLCTSVIGNNCEVLTITDNIRTFTNYADEQTDWNISFGGRKLRRLKRKKAEGDVAEGHKHKKVIVFTSRVHSGETVSSFMVQGAIDYLLSDCKQAKLLRNHFIFKIIPMLNPDGVRYGNFRCCLLGTDLNRRWDKPNKILHPTIYYAKKMIQVLNENYKVQLFCDMHGHTRKKNVFMYGCSIDSTDYLDHRKNLLAKVIPVLMATRNSFFSFSDSHFRMEQDKLSTARIVVFNEFQIPNSYTMEASFFGPKSPEAFGKGYSGDMHMTRKDLGSCGEALSKLCMIYISQAVFYQKLRFVSDYLNARLTKKISIKDSNTSIPETGTEIELEAEINTTELIEPENLWKSIEICSYKETEEDSGGSESCPSESEVTLKSSKISAKALKVRTKSLKKQSAVVPKVFSDTQQKYIIHYSVENTIKPKPSAKTFAMPKLRENKTRTSLPAGSIRVNQDSNTKKILIIPKLNLLPSLINDTDLSIRYKSLQNMSKFSHTKKISAMPTETPNSVEFKSIKSIPTPKDYKQNSLCWIGSNPQTAARNLANKTRSLVNKIFNKLTDRH
jgi:Zinc carboxypeptidase/Cytosolic carboxypeptidase N-terminal domain